MRYKDLPLRAKDGHLIPVEFVSNVYLAGTQKVIQCNIRDISERKEAQDALLRSEAMYREQSVRDHLTGLFNRRYMEETLNRDLLLAARRRTSVSLIMLDVDGFKSINDTLGHAAGDDVLRALGRLLKQNVRAADVACRFGGDEFILVLPGLTRAMALLRAQLLRAAVAKSGRLGEGLSPGTITLSAGVAAFPEDGLTGVELLNAVDGALYRAKQDGPRSMTKESGMG